MTGYRAATIGFAAAALALAGCGSTERQDVNEPSGTFKVDVTNASFPSAQHVAAPSKMRIAVKNTGDAAIPQIAVTVDSFSRRAEQPGLADPGRPIWVVDKEPTGGTTAYTDTWALDRLAPGQTKTFTWAVTPIEPGRYSIKYTIAAGLNGKAKARTESGEPVTGSFPVEISKTPAQARVDPATGEVQRLP